jgi:hypothetical protein
LKTLFAGLMKIISRLMKIPLSGLMIAALSEMLKTALSGLIKIYVLSDEDKFI